MKSSSSTTSTDSDTQTHQMDHSELDIKDTKHRKVVYAASLDPITNGHINVIERISPLYDQVFVIVAVDSTKTYTFSPDERVAMVRDAVAHLPNVCVDVCIGHYVVSVAEKLGAHVIIRGLRNFKDLEAEQVLATENRRICPNIETLWLPCHPDLMHVSSSMVKSHVGCDPQWEAQVARSVPLNVVARLKEKFLLKKARQHWVKLMSILGNPKESEKVYIDLLVRYSEPERKYHTLEHVINMLDELESIGEYDPAIALATWLHDAIYDSRAKDNETQSAVLARHSTKEMGLAESLNEEVCSLIMATTHTQVPLTLKAQTLVDLDLAILGKPEKEFDTYETNIRAEYAWVSQSEFCTGRARILQSFLDRPSIYSTQTFRDRYEHSARKNLSRSIEKLKSQTTEGLKS